MSVIWPQIGSNIAGQYDDDLFGNSISLSDDGTIVAIGAIWYDGGSITFTASLNLDKNIDIILLNVLKKFNS